MAMAAENETNTKTNREYWNSKSDTYNSLAFDPLTILLTQTLQSHSSWLPLPPTGHVLDFACGTGLISNILAQLQPNLVFRGIDISDKMVARYNERFNSTDPASSSSIDASAVEVNLMDASAFQAGSPIAGSEWLEFDLAIVVNGLHHIGDAGVAVGRLVERIKVEGVLCVVDWVDDGKRQGHGHHRHGEKEGNAGNGDGNQQALLKKRGVAHGHGFSEKRITTLMKDAGLEDIGFVELEEVVRFGSVERKLFIARGKKAAPVKLGLSKATAWNLMH